MKKFLIWIIAKAKINSIYRKVLLCFLTIILLVLCLCTSIYHRGMNLVKQEVYDTLYEQNRNIAHSFSNEGKRILMMQYQFVESNHFVELKVAEQRKNISKKNNSILNIQTSLQSIWKGSSLIEEIRIVIPSSNLVISTGTVTEMNHEATELIEGCEDIDSKQIIMNNGQICILAEYPYRYYELGIDAEYIIYTILSKDALRTYLNSKGNDSSKNISHLLYSAKENIFIGMRDNNDNQEIQEILRQCLTTFQDDNLFLKKDGYLISITSLENSDMKCIGYAKEKDIFKDLNTYQYIYLLLIGTIMVSGIWFLKKIFRMIHTPLHVLVEGLEEVKKGNLDKTILCDGEDEFVYIYHNFNEMTSQLKELIDKTYKQELLLQKAELRQLQTQITPHFLYNSFIVLSNRISAGDHEFAALFSQQLGQYFMFITRNRKEFITLKEELEHACVYANIQHTRFRNRFEMQLDPLTESFNEVMVPRLIIQPVLENVFKYVVDKEVSNSFLHLYFEPQDTYFNICIEDSGKNVGPEKLAIMRGQLESTDGEIRGITNIHQRLQIIYGNTCGIQLSNSPYGGLKVTIRILYLIPNQ